jgi:hypothetical protein
MKRSVKLCAMAGLLAGAVTFDARGSGADAVAIRPYCVRLGVLNPTGADYRPLQDGQGCALGWQETLASGTALMSRGRLVAPSAFDFALFLAMLGLPLAGVIWGVRALAQRMAK